MKLTMERLPESRVQLEIVAEEAESAEAMQRAVRKVGNQIALPGFRKGKAPRAMIERVYGPDVFVEEANRYLMTDLYRQALEQTDITPVGDPEVDIAATDPLTFTVVVPVYPEIDPGPYRDVRIEPIDASVDDATVDELIEGMRRNISPWVDAQSEGLQVGAGLELSPKSRYPREGDQVTIDYSVQAEGEPAEEPEVDAEFVLGESGLLEAIEDAIKGLRVGETTGFSVLFEEEDETVDPDLRGKTLSYTVTLKGLRERELVPLDDAFAKQVGNVETLDELRQSFRDELHRNRTSYAQSDAVAQIVEKIVEGATIELPAPMIDRAVEGDLRRFRGRLAQQGASLEAYLRATGQTEDEVRAELRPAATARLRNALLLRAVAEKEGITIDDAQLDSAVERLAASLQESGNARQAQRFARSEYIRDTLEQGMFERQLTARLLEIATEGGNAVINGWEPPVAAEITEVETSAAAKEGAASGEE
ncbi:MAG: trigger factor [Thermomicrobiales bacterium]